MRIAILDVDIPVYHCAISCEDDDDFNAVKRTVDCYLREWLRVSKSTHYIGFITDSKSNFRIDRAFTWEYKGHRKSKAQPRWYPAIREYVMDKWKVQLMVGIEADDALTIAAEVLRAEGYEVVIVTEDKDLLQYPGLHYNKNKSDEVFEITELEGFKNLWTQVITGDRTDNIPGVSQACHETVTGKYNQMLKDNESLSSKERTSMYRRYSHLELYGPAGALKYLESFPIDLWPSKVWELYVDKYEDMNGDEGYGDLRFLETFDLIFMLRKEPEGLEINYDFHSPPIDKEVFELFEDFD